MKNLKFEEDIDLINNIKNNLNVGESIKKLEARHSGICHQMIQKYKGALNCVGLDCGDLNDEKTYLIYKSALKFNPDKNIKFSTWLGNQMRYLCLNSLNKENGSISMDNEKIKTIIERKQLDCNIHDYVDKSNYIFEILNNLKDKRIKEIFRLRYFGNCRNKSLSWHKIGDLMNLSTQTVINLHNKNIKILCEKLNDKNCIDKT
jgi:RNA polymerase sigma factor (sigma-70 family)